MVSRREAECAPRARYSGGKNPSASQRLGKSMNIDVFFELQIQRLKRESARYSIVSGDNPKYVKPSRAVPKERLGPRCRCGRALQLDRRRCRVCFQLHPQNEITDEVEK